MSMRTDRPAGYAARASNRGGAIAKVREAIAGCLEVRAAEGAANSINRAGFRILLRAVLTSAQRVCRTRKPC